MKKEKGFTLIELLVVIAVISVLASVILGSLNSARAKSRNARRNSDIGQLIKAFNLGLTANNTLPATGDAWICVSELCYGGWSGYVGNATVNAFLSPNMPTKPQDPAGSRSGYGGYLYNAAYTGTSSYDGYVFQTGGVIHWLAEKPVTSSACAPGRIMGVYADFITCVAGIAP